MRDRTRNEDVLASFTAYCEMHPDQRFWQALRNWSGHSFIIARDYPPTPDDRPQADTFFWEGRNR